jgi:Helix-turn-helix domain/HNH endonuclease
MPAPNRTLAYLIEAIKLHGGSDKCLLWALWRDKDGYGRCTYNGGHARVPRVAYELFVGPIPAGKLIRHSCDTPPCFNPKHLLPGTVADNDRDRDMRGRASGPKGAENFNSKLTVDDVREIRRQHDRGDSFRVIGRRFNVSRTTIWHAVKGRTWRHVT